MVCNPQYNNAAANCAAAINSKSASGMGVDVGLTYTPIADVKLSVNFSWNGLTQDADVVAYPKGVPAGVVIFPKGTRLNLSPETTAGASADYVFAHWGAGYQARAEASVNYTSGQFYKRLVGTGVDITPGQSITIGRVSATIDSPDRWSATLYVDDINNEQNSVFLHWTDLQGANLHVRPRTGGVQVDYHY